MRTGNQIRVEIHCQKGKRVEIEVPRNGGIVEKDGMEISVSETAESGCAVGHLRLKIKPETLTESFNLTMEAPVRVYLPLKVRPDRITAMTLFNPWWTRPVFVKKLQDIPERTQIAFFDCYGEDVCFLPMAGDKWKTFLTAGTETELCLEMTAHMGGLHEIDEPLYLFSSDAYGLERGVHNIFALLAEKKGIRLREQRRVPEMLRYLGWCSWDACYTDVNEKIIRQKADELHEKQVPVRWMLIDDGWFAAKDKTLYDFAPDPVKFPNGFAGMIEDIRSKTDIRWFGIWHALGGYWDGVAPDSPLAAKEAPYLYQAASGRLVPSPKTGAGFYDDWCKVLKKNLVDFIKVDGQSATPLYFENCLPVSEAARGMNEALESGAYRMDGAIINCMGMAMENVLARPASAVSRNSDDFVPLKESSFAEHLLQNAYNAIYHNEIYCCDWDMFWTKHEDAVKHSLLRAVSGGPVYFSDKIGDTIPEVLKPLVYQDGRVLMMDRSAKPTEDCVFSNPMEDGVLKLHNVAAWGEGRKGGGIAVYNLTEDRQAFTFAPADIPDLDGCGQYWVYDFFQKKVYSLGIDETYQNTIESKGVAWYVILPQVGNAACLGLLDKYVGFSAVESVRESEHTSVFVLRASGTAGWLSDRMPQNVMLDGADVTGKIKRDGNLWELPLPEDSKKSVLSIRW